ncbi:MAG: dephospho-CoA kinase [Christensenellaceae bacterium]|jgi:dephospho-CoA kinase|nr:dephospho-CoA kinase [Christensenellaceae bacterium]
MITIGLTGGIAAGKSTVSQRLRELGAYIIDADAIAHDVVAPGTAGLAALTARFGADILLPNGALNRRALGELVFDDAAALSELNAIVHPLVLREMRRQVAAAQASGARVAVLDVPLLLEGGLQREAGEVWLVCAPKPVRMARMRQRDGLTEEQAQRRMDAQMPEAEKRALADVIFENDSTVEALLFAVDAQYARVMEL